MLELRTLLEMLSTAQTATCDTIWTSMSDSDLNIRYHVYRHFAEHGQAPEYAEIARVVSAPNDEVRAAFHRLHDRHMLFLEPGVATCIAHCHSRPWEPHKFKSPEEQDRHFSHLLAWVRDYYRRDGDASLRQHQALFDAFDGPKHKLTARTTASAFGEPSLQPV